MCVLVIFLLLTSISAAITERCKTPNNEEADCVSLYSCPILISALATQQNASIEFVQRSNCGGTGTNPMVCCGSASSFTTPQKTHLKNETTNVNKESLLPSRKYCGYQHADDYFHTGNGTSIDEFPWLANLLYMSGTEISTQCGGTLISDKYILTAAHCVQNTNKYELVKVRLGEFNVKNATDCIGDNTDLYECTEPPQEFDIERKIVHSRYNEENTSNNDIALLRLNKRAKYSDYVRPICLPTSGTGLAQPGDTLTTTGWGITAQRKPTEIKKKVLLKLITNEECLAAATFYKKYITPNQFCTTSLETNIEFACKGDSGNPITYSNRNQWYQEGISSFGPADCQSGIPDVHTKVVNYIDWIKENIEP